jgi:arsenite methyltransferase
MEDLHRQLRNNVLEAYSAAAQNPLDAHTFPVGRLFASSLGYSDVQLDSLPHSCVEAFTGVSNVSVFAEIPPGASVLDVGCGAGLDGLIAAQRSGPNGHVIGVDFSETMLLRARASASEARIDNVVFCRADAEYLPVANDSVDVALANGVFNLNPGRGSIFRELARVVRAGGVVFSAELILMNSLPTGARRSATDWLA